jgi:arylsulfatase A-like enzyme/tetratricopeptide (TPR) repeat protein
MKNPNTWNRAVLSAAFLALLTAAVWTASCATSGKDASGMNLLLITLDTTRADAVGLYGGRRDVTPNIDGLGRNGVLFERCVTPVPLTLPAHASLLTGRDPIAHLVRNNGTYVLGDDERTLAEVFLELGYRTSAIVSSFTVASKFGLAQGFESYDEGFESESAFLNFNTEIPADRVHEQFVRWLDGRPAGRFFSWVHFYDPHFPYHEHPDPPGPPAASNWDLYLGEVRYMDHYVGRVVEELRSRGLYESTVIVIAGDHGEAFGEHGEFGHGVFCYEESLRVPLLFHNPRLFPSARTIRDPVGLIDVMPTALDLFGIKVPATVQGRSFRAGLDGRKVKPRGPLYFESLYGQEKNNWAPLTGLIAGPTKYISLPEPELYDLERDGRESRNLAVERPAEAREMDRRLREFILAAGSTREAGRRALDPSDLQKLTALGYVSAFSGKAGKMIDPKTAIAVYGEVSEIKNVLGTGDVAQAERRLEAVRNKAPDLALPDILTVSYKIKKRRGDRAGALEVLTKALEDFPAVESFKVSLIDELVAGGELEAAAEWCRRFLAENERMTAAWIFLGDIDMGRGRTEAAAEKYDKALALEPENSVVRIKFAGALASAGDLAKAEAILAKLEAQPRVARTRDYGRTISDLGLKILFSGEKDRGLGWIEKACALTPEEPGVWVNRGVARFAEREFEAALGDYGQALELDPASAPAHSNIGILYLSRFTEEQDPSLLDKALLSLNKAIEHDPGLASAYNGRGSVHLTWGELAPAVRDFERAIELDAGQGDAYVNMALALQLQGRYNEALGYLDRFKDRFYRLMPPAEREEIDRLYGQIKAMRGNG